METLKQHIARRIRETGAPTEVYRALHRLCTRAINADPPLIDRRELWKDDKIGVRDQAKVGVELELLWQRMPRRVSATLEQYLAEKLAAEEVAV